MVKPKVTFGMIVLNGEPFVRYNLRALYPFAHQIIVVEGAAKGAAKIASSDGHSTDGTLDSIAQFIAHEDPDDKVLFVTAEDEGYSDGFWPREKLEASQAYAKRATGDYLWEVDVDEFYLPEDMMEVFRILGAGSALGALSFHQITFWGGFDYLADGWYLRLGWAADGINRVFKWGDGYQYVTHHPPTVHDERGHDVRSAGWLDGRSTSGMGIYMYHYSLVFPRQVLDKSAYYAQADWAGIHGAARWAEESFLTLKHPFRVHNMYQYPSWLERFNDVHPPQIVALRKDIASGLVNAELRPVEDTEELLESHAYRIGRAGLKLLEPLNRIAGNPWRRVRKLAAPF